MNHSAAAAYTSMAQPFGVSAHTPPHMPTVRQDSMGKFLFLKNEVGYSLIRTKKKGRTLYRTDADDELIIFAVTVSSLLRNKMN